ncbi:MAG TPA: hypothetical protein VGG35_11525 [Streptosporangiaceae bacterium]|jgi:hypothetical protein
MSAPTPPAPWIDWSALWQILVLAVIAGAGLPALFAVGLRALRPGGRQAATAGADSGTAAAVNPISITLAGLCFAVVLAAVGWGIYAIVSGA